MACPLNIIGPDGVTTNHYYTADIAQNQVGSTAATGFSLYAISDPLGHGKHEVTDGLGRLAYVRELTGTGASLALYATTKYAYDVLDSLSKVTDGAGNVTDSPRIASARAQTHRSCK